MLSECSRRASYFPNVAELTATLVAFASRSERPVRKHRDRIGDLGELPTPSVMTSTQRVSSFYSGVLFYMSRKADRNDASLRYWTPNMRLMCETEKENSGIKDQVLFSPSSF